MKDNLNKNLANNILKVVLIVSNCIDTANLDLSVRYKLSIKYVYDLLAVIYAEELDYLDDQTLVSFISIVKSPKEKNTFIDILYSQIESLGISKIMQITPLSYKIIIDDDCFVELINILRLCIKDNDLNPEFLGYLYEFLQQFELTLNSNTSQPEYKFSDICLKYTLLKSNNLRKKQGSFFTPQKLITCLIDSSLTLKLNSLTSLNDFLDMKILDPACGGGNILLRVYQKMLDFALNKLDQSTNIEEIKRLILKKCIFGIDIDSFACYVTKLNLFLLSRKTDHFDNIICGNFLIDKPNNNVSAMFNKNNSKFSLVIGNPPYLNIQNINTEEKAYYLSKYKSAYRRFDIFLLFFERALEEILKDGGTVSFVVPDKILTQTYAIKLRKYILKNHSIREIVSFKDSNIFKNTAVHPVIVAVNKGKSGKSEVKTTELVNGAEEVNFLDQAIFSSFYNCNFRVGWNIHKQKIIDLIQSKSFPLHKLCYISWGAQPGDASKFIYQAGNLPDPNYKKFLKPLIRGGDIDRYNISYSGDYLLYLTTGEFKLHRPAFPELFESKKIVVSEVTATKGIVASLDKKGFYTNHSVINCIHKRDLAKINPDLMPSRGIRLSNSVEESTYKWIEQENSYSRGTVIYKDSRFNNLSLEYALAVINSKLMNFYFKNYLSGNLNVFPELVRFMPVFDLPATYSQADTHYSVSKLIADNDREGLSKLIFEVIKEREYVAISNVFSEIVSYLLNLRLNHKLEEFEYYNHLIDKSVFDLYELSPSQINYVNASNII